MPLPWLLLWEVQPMRYSLLAMAHAADIELSLDDFTEIGKRVPVLCDLKPSGKYNMSHFVVVVRPLLKTLLEEDSFMGTA